MYKIKKLFKNLFTKVFLAIFFLACFLVLFFYWGWFERQYDKALGMYYVYKGDKAYSQHHLQKAIDYYNQGLALFPRHYGARFNLGNIYVVYEDYYSAVESYEKAIAQNENFTLARMNLGIIFAEKIGDFDSAIAQYQAIIDSNAKVFSIPFIFSNKKSERKNKGIAYYNKGIAYRQKSLYLGDDDEKASIFLMKSIDSYRSAIKFLKDNYDLRYNLALAYHLLGNYQKAGLTYCEAIELSPMDYEAHYNLAILLRHLKMYKEAKEELEKASILISSGDANSHTSRYVFDVLNDVSQIFSNRKEYEHLVEKIDEEPSYYDNITYVNGKIVASDELDKAMLKNFRSCRTKKLFKEYE